MHKTPLLPFVGCSVVAAFLLLPSSDRLAAQPANIDPRAAEEMRKGAREGERQINEIGRQMARETEEEEKLKEQFFLYFPLYLMVGALGLAALAGLFFLFDLVERLYHRRKGANSSQLRERQ
jgi:hypothetical protein